MQSLYGNASKGALGIVICCRRECASPDYAQIDCSAATENLLLEADTLGLGAVWMGIAPVEERMEKAREILEIPSHLYAFAFVACGYPLKRRSSRTVSMRRGFTMWEIKSG